MNRVLSSVSLLVSVLALGLGLAAYLRSPVPGPTPEAINQMIVEKLEQRDRARVAALAPRAKAVYRDMLSPDKFNPDTFAPTTYEELFTPLISIVNDLTVQP